MCEQILSDTWAGYECLRGVHEAKWVETRSVCVCVDVCFWMCVCVCGCGCVCGCVCVTHLGLQCQGHVKKAYRIRCVGSLQTHTQA